MVIVNLKGGLGNQIYQYMFGKYISEVSHKSLVCNISFYKLQYLFKISNRKFELDFIFNKILIKNHYFFLLVRYDFFKFLIGKGTLIIDDNFDYQKLFSFPFYKYNKIILNGFFQSNPFLFSIISKCDFDFKNYPYQNVNFSDSICVHVRKGDYLNNLDIYCNLNGKYFSDSIELAFVSLGKSVPIYFISDDLNWVRKHVDFNPSYEYSFINSDKSYLDFIFLKNIKNVILSNSTFSISATILSLNEKNLVIAPKNYLVDSVKNCRFKDFNYFEKWLLV